MTNAFLLVAAVVLVSYSNVMIKLRATHFGGGGTGQGIVSYFISMAIDPWIWTASVAFVTAAVFWLLVVRRLELSVAQPIMALVFVTVPLAAARFLGEPLPPLRLVGMVLILLGVVLIARTA